VYADVTAGNESESNGQKREEECVVATLADGPTDGRTR
jgi:hypothetical protein